MNNLSDNEQIFACMKCAFSGTRQEAQTHAMFNPEHRGFIYPGSKGRTPNYEMNYIERRIKELLPDSFYADRTVEFRVKMLVESWKRVLQANEALLHAKMQTMYATEYCSCEAGSDGDCSVHGPILKATRTERWTFGLFTFCIGVILGATLHHFGIF